MGFLEEFYKLRLVAPRIALMNPKCVNSDYINQCYHTKNGYLCFGSDENEDVMYCKWVNRSKDMVDCSYCEKCEVCFECLDCVGCYDCQFLQDCENCDACFLGNDLKGCRDCFGCAGLRRKRFCIFNEQFASKEEYEAKVRELKQSFYGGDEVAAKFEDVRLKTPVLYSKQLHSENAVGDYILNSKNVYASFDIQDGWDLQYVTEAYKCRDCVDCFCMGGNELCYECMGHVNTTNCNFCPLTCIDSSNLEYCELCWSCHDCFGCIALQRKRYCILNVQYASREEYNAGVVKIKKNMHETGEYGIMPEAAYKAEDTVLFTT